MAKRRVNFWGVKPSPKVLEESLRLEEATDRFLGKFRKFADQRPAQPQPYGVNVIPGYVPEYIHDAMLRSIARKQDEAEQRLRERNRKNASHEHKPKVPDDVMQGAVNILREKNSSLCGGNLTTKVLALLYAHGEHRVSRPPATTQLKRLYPSLYRKKVKDSHR